MGLDIQAWVGYGVRIPLRKFTTVASVPSCGHPEREGQQYCPVCGSRVRSTERDVLDPRVEALRSLDEPPLLEGDSIFQEIPQLTSAVVVSDYISEAIWVLGWYAEGEYESCGGPIIYPNFDGVIDIARAAGLVKDALERVGLEDTFRYGLIVNTVYPN